MSSRARSAPSADVARGAPSRIAANENPITVTWTPYEADVLARHDLGGRRSGALASMDRARGNRRRAHVEQQRRHPHHDARTLFLGEPARSMKSGASMPRPLLTIAFLAIFPGCEDPETCPTVSPYDGGASFAPQTTSVHANTPPLSCAYFDRCGEIVCTSVDDSWVCHRNEDWNECDGSIESD